MLIQAVSRIFGATLRFRKPVFWVSQNIWNRRLYVTTTDMDTAESLRGRSNRIFRSCHFISRGILSQSVINSCGADAIILDMEDAIPASEKESTRQVFAQMFEKMGRTNKSMYIRINAIGEGESWIQDLTYLTHPLLQGFMLAKVEHENEIVECDSLLSSREKELGLPRGYFKLIPTIESIPGVARCHNIANSSKLRNVALIEGNQDLATEIQADVDGETLNSCHREVILAARIADLIPLFGVINRIDSHNNFIKQCQRLKQIGFEGMASINPTQMRLAQEAFTITPRELQTAMEVEEKWMKKDKSESAIYQRSRNDGKIFLSKPHVKWASRMLLIAEEQKTVDGLGKVTAKSSQKRVRLRDGAEKLDHLSVGQTVKCPIELTLDSAMMGIWEGSFFNCLKIYTSDKFCAQLGLRERMLPYGMIMVLTAGLSVMRFSEAALYHLGLYTVIQHRPVYVGDTVSNEYEVTWIKPSGTQKEHDIVGTKHRLLNQHGELVMSLEKRTTFSAGKFSRENICTEIPKLDVTIEVDSPLRTTALTNYRPTENGPTVHLHQPGDLYVHRFMKVFGQSESRALCTMFRLTNDFHYNHIRFRDEDVLVPGPLVQMAAASNLLFDYGEIIHEYVLDAQVLNKTNMCDMISTVTYVMEKNDIPENSDLEELTLKIIGIINIDPAELEDVQIPEILLTSKTMKPSAVESILAEDCPILFHKLATIETRKIIRQKLI